MRDFGKTVLIGTSLDVESDEVVRVGLDIAARMGAHPIVANAFEPISVSPMPLGSLDPDCIHTPGIFVHRILQGQHEKRIEQRTLRTA